MRDLPESTADKLQAVLLCRNNDCDGDGTRVHLEVCRQWFNGLSDAQRKVADLAAWAYETGNETSAEKIASNLPAAPRCPLLARTDLRARQHAGIDAYL
jgi:hypothetical protein